MTPNVAAKVVRAAAAVVLAAGLGPIVLAGSAHAATDGDSAQAADVGPSAVEVPYAEQVDIGDALRIGNPDIVDEPASDLPAPVSTGAADAPRPESAGAQARPPVDRPMDESSVTATPPGAVVIEVSSWQPVAADIERAARASDGGTEVRSDGSVERSAEGSAAPVRLPETGPPALAAQLLIAFGLIALGAAMRGGPQLLAIVSRGAARRH